MLSDQAHPPGVGNNTDISVAETRVGVALNKLNYRALWRGDRFLFSTSAAVSADAFAVNFFSGARKL
jgi:hypothetical protein